MREQIIKVANENFFRFLDFMFPNMRSVLNIKKKHKCASLSAPGNKEGSSLGALGIRHKYITNAPQIMAQI